MKALSLIQIKTELYQASHNGKKPRGEGRWFFEARILGQWVLLPISQYKLYSEAAKDAKKWAVANDVSTLRVAP